LATPSARGSSANLHDGAQQGLIATGLTLRLAAIQRPDPALDEALAELEQLVSAVRSIAHGIHPTVLASEGLGPALETKVDETSRLAVTLRLDPVLGRLPDAVEISAYEMVQEAIANATLTGLGAFRSMRRSSPATSASRWSTMAQAAPSCARAADSKPSTTARSHSEAR